MTKTRRIIWAVLMGLPSAALFIGGIMKLADAEPEQVVAFLTHMGYGGYMKVIGGVSVAIAALHVYAKTYKIGLLLASCYFSGALALEIGGRQMPVSALFIILLWAAAYIKDKEIFIGYWQKQVV